MDVGGALDGYLASGDLDDDPVVRRDVTRSGLVDDVHHVVACVEHGLVVAQYLHAESQFTAGVLEQLKAKL